MKSRLYPASSQQLGNLLPCIHNRRMIKTIRGASSHKRFHAPRINSMPLKSRNYETNPNNPRNRLHLIDLFIEKRTHFSLCQIVR